MEDRFKQLYNHKATPPTGAFDHIIAAAKPVRKAGVYAKWFVGMMGAGLLLLVVAIYNQQIVPYELAAQQEQYMSGKESALKAHVPTEKVESIQHEDEAVNEFTPSNRSVVESATDGISAKPASHSWQLKSKSAGTTGKNADKSLGQSQHREPSPFGQNHSINQQTVNGLQPMFNRFSIQQSDNELMGLSPLNVDLITPESRSSFNVQADVNKAIRKSPILFSPYFFIGRSFINDRYNDVDNVICYRNKESFGANGSNVAFEVGLSAIQPINRYLSFQLSSGLYFDKYTTSYSALHVNATEQIKQHSEHMIEIIPDHISELQTYNHDMVAISVRPELQVYPFRTSRFYLKSGLLMQFRINGAEAMRSDVRNQIELSRNTRTVGNNSTISNFVFGVGYHLKVSNSFIAVEPSLQLPVNNKVNSSEMSIYRYQAGVRLSF